MAPAIRSLFDRLKQTDGARKSGANRKGDGFHFARPDMGRSKNRLFTYVGGAVGLSLMTSAAVILYERQASIDFLAMVGAFSALSFMLVYDMVGRRKWEGRVTDQMRTLIRNHDRLVREVARNRSDLSILKDGLADMSGAVDQQTRKLPAALQSAEARMIDMIANQLASLGMQRRPELKTGHDDHILELEIAPPPPRPPSLTALEKELNGNADGLSDLVISELLHHAVGEGRIEIFTQPVVSLPQRTPHMIEYCTRIRAGAGQYITASRFAKIAAEEGLLPSIDHLVLLRALRDVEEQAKAAQGHMPVILNIAGASLRDRVFINEFLTFIARNPGLARMIVLEMRQAEYEALPEKFLPMLGGLAKLGVRFSMDDVRRKRIDILRLKQFNIRYLKLDSAWLSRESGLRGGMTRLHHLKKQLTLAGIDMVADRVENEAQTREILDCAVDYAQGYVFARPAMHTQWKAKAPRTVTRGKVA